MPPPIHAQAPRAGKFDKPRGDKIDNALKGLETLQRNELEEEIPKAKDCLQTYVDQLFSYHVGHRKVYIERAEAKLRRDGASRTVYRWLHHRNVRYYITHHLDQSQPVKEVLDLAVQVIAGGDCWYLLGHWLLNGSPKHASDKPSAYIKGVRVWCHLFTAICRALYRWDPGDASGRSAKFLAHCVRETRDHVDLLPLLIQALEEASRRPSRSHDDFENLLDAAKREAFGLEAELQLLRVELCLYHPVNPSPWEFRKLLNTICAECYHPLRVDPPRQDPLHRSFLMHRLAARCADLLDSKGFPGCGPRVLQNVKQVYNDGFLTYNRWAHGWDKEKKYKDPQKVKRWMKKFGFDV